MYSSNTLEEFLHYKNLVLHKSWADFRAEAERTYLGIAWWVLEPLVDLAIYFLVFGVFLRHGSGEFVTYLLTGLVIWRFFATTVQRSAGSILVNVNMVRQISFRKVIFPVISFLTCSMEFVFSLLLLLCFLYYRGETFGIYYLAFPVLLVMLALVVLGLGLPLAALVPFVPDLSKLIQYALRILFFMSGIIYEVNLLPDSVRPYLYYNPMVGIIQTFRDCLMYERWPDWGFVATVSAVSICLAVLGAILISRFDPLYAKRITR